MGWHISLNVGGQVCMKAGRAEQVRVAGRSVRRQSAGGVPEASEGGEHQGPPLRRVPALDTHPSQAAAALLAQA